MTPVRNDTFGEAISPQHPLSPDSERPSDSIEDKILDAARSCLLDFGLRRTTLAEIARRAGVSRPTVYRRWPDTDSVLADLLTREIRAALPDTRGIGPTRPLLVSAVIAAAYDIGTHPIFEKVLRTTRKCSSRTSSTGSAPVNASSSMSSSLRSNRASAMAPSVPVTHTRSQRSSCSPHNRQCNPSA